MSLSELLPKLHSLSRADKLQLIQLMVVDLAREEGVALSEVSHPYPVWSPYDAFDAAEAMLKAVRGESGG